ncbi:hypothetical protein D3C73_1366050 [compost metagenome]
MIDTYLRGDGFGCPLIISRNHDDLNTHLFQTAYRGFGCFLDRIRDGYHTCITVIERDQHSGLTVFL